MSSALTAEVIEHFEALPYTLQEQIASLVRTLNLSLTRDATGKKLLRFAGSIPEADLQAMRDAIGTGCEQVDIDEW